MKEQKRNTKCMHCSKTGIASRGVCGAHYAAVNKLAKKYGWDELVKKGVCLEKESKPSMYRQLEEKLLQDNKSVDN